MTMIVRTQVHPLLGGSDFCQMSPFVGVRVASYELHKIGTVHGVLQH
jgi:hypothetical protein